MNWAKSNESFPSYTEDHGNAYPTTNSHTESGLEEGAEYKVRVRARLFQGSGEQGSFRTMHGGCNPGSWQLPRTIGLAGPGPTPLNDGTPSCQSES